MRQERVNVIERVVCNIVGDVDGSVQEGVNVLSEKAFLRVTFLSFRERYGLPFDRIFYRYHEIKGEMQMTILLSE